MNKQDKHDMDTAHRFYILSASGPVNGYMYSDDIKAIADNMNLDVCCVISGPKIDNPMRLERNLRTLDYNKFSIVCVNGKEVKVLDAKQKAVFCMFLTRCDCTSGQLAQYLANNLNEKNAKNLHFAVAFVDKDTKNDTTNADGNKTNK